MLSPWRYAVLALMWNVWLERNRRLLEGARKKMQSYFGTGLDI